jgi:lipoyl(octanoyl) transferase
MQQITTNNNQLENTSLTNSIIVKSLGLCQYQDIWPQMQAFTKQRTATTPDELWYLEHYPVFTLGQAGDKKHLLNPGNIPVVYSDRGGQVTYHGPGQLVVYILSSLVRKNLPLRQLLQSMQNAVVDLLANYHVQANGNLKNPGVYVRNAKVCSIGLKVHKGAVYHGLSLNVNMDLTPFTRINPCGQSNLAITQLSELGINEDLPTIANILLCFLMQHLNYLYVL